MSSKSKAFLNREFKTGWHEQLRDGGPRDEVHAREFAEDFANENVVHDLLEHVVSFRSDALKPEVAAAFSGLLTKAQIPHSVDEKHRLNLPRASYETLRDQAVHLKKRAGRHHGHFETLRDAAFAQAGIEQPRAHGRR